MTPPVAFSARESTGHYAKPPGDSTDLRVPEDMRTPLWRCEASESCAEATPDTSASQGLDDPSLNDANGRHGVLEGEPVTVAQGLSNGAESRLELVLEVLSVSYI